MNKTQSDIRSLAAALQPSRRSAVAPFIVMDVMQAAAEREALGHKIIHMEVGQPGTPAPRAALARVARALDRETLGYTVALGLPALRERIARHYQERYGVHVEPERVIVTTGSSAGFVLAFLALFDVGSKVALPSPGYPCYRHILTALGQSPVPIDDRCRHALDADRAQIEEALPQPGDRRPRGRQPRQSNRHHAGARAPGRDRGGLPAQRRLVRFRRDLSRPHLWHGGGDRAGAFAPTRSSSTASPSISR